MESKIEVLVKNGAEDCAFSDVLSAMDAYAKQEAIEFAKWINENYRHISGKNIWVDFYYEQFPSQSPNQYYIEQLYEKYTKSK